MVRNLKNMKSRFYLLTVFSFLILLSACGIFRKPPNPLTHDEGVVINGVRWATRNVDMPGTFATSPESFGMLYQWNRRIGWSNTYPMINSDGETIWDISMPGGTAWYAENDPCPPGWRVPTQEEFSTLIDPWIQHYHNMGRRREGSLNGVYGIFLGTAPNEIFLPAAGHTRLANFPAHNVGGQGNYWTATSCGNYHGREVSFSAVRPGIFRNVTGSVIRFTAQSIRCVAL